jgi:general stress protein 26
MTDSNQLCRDMWNRMAESPFLMVGLDGTGLRSEPLTAQLDQDQVDTLWFFVRTDNRLAGGGEAVAQFVSKGHDFFASLAGTISQDNDPSMIDRLWNKTVEAWFEGGRDDPKLALLRLDINAAEVWETDVSLSGRLKMLFGGTIKASERSSHAVVGTTAISSGDD